MRTLIVGSLMFVASCIFCFAADKTPAQAAFDNAAAIYAQKDYSTARIAFEKLIKDFPQADELIILKSYQNIGYCFQNVQDYESAKPIFEKILKDYASSSNTYVLANSQYCIGTCLARLNKEDIGIAITAAQKVLTDYQDPTPGSKYPSLMYCVKAAAQGYIGSLLFSQGKFIEAQKAFEEVLKSYSKIPAQNLLNAQIGVGNALKAQGKLTEATKAYMLAVQNYVQVIGSKDEQGSIWTTWEKIDPKQVTSQEYKSFLDETIRVTKATEDNAKFLGKIKSELEKMK